MTGTDEPTCAVCGDTVQESTSAICTGCDQRFHLNLRTDAKGKDCGDVWIDEQSLSLRFACFNCLRREAAPAGEGEPPVGEAH
jgi:hypothetical protein